MAQEDVAEATTHVAGWNCHVGLPDMTQQHVLMSQGGFLTNPRNEMKCRNIIGCAAGIGARRVSENIIKSRSDLFAQTGTEQVSGVSRTLLLGVGV